MIPSAEFAEGQGLSEHTAPFDAFVHDIDGEGRFVVGGEDVICGAGDLLLMPADIPHAVTPGSPFKMLLVMLRPITSK